MAEEEKPDKPEEPPKVVTLSGEPYVPPEELAIKPCARTLDCLEDVVKHAKANEIRGIFALGWSPRHKRFVRWMMMPCEEEEHTAAVRFIGGMEMAKSDLLQMALDNVTFIDDDGEPIE